MVNKYMLTFIVHNDSHRKGDEINIKEHLDVVADDKYEEKYKAVDESSTSQPHKSRNEESVDKPLTNQNTKVQKDNNTQEHVLQKSDTGFYNEYKKKNSSNKVSTPAVNKAYNTCGKDIKNKNQIDVNMKFDSLNKKASNRTILGK